MAKKRRKSSKKSRGGTLFGILIGLILGLVAAVAVALFVTRAPMPFADKASRDPAQTLLPDVRDAPDPNIGLRGQQSDSQSTPSGETPGDSRSHSDRKELDNLIANLAKTAEPSEPVADEPSEQGSEGAKADSSSGAVDDPVIPGVTDSKSTRSTKSDDGPDKPDDATNTPYFLQAGAFRSEDDAESVKAQILLMGLPVEVQKADIEGGTINRVRVGPFTGIDAMNQARSQLGDKKIESSVIRP